jgi:hypothetical protein
MKTTTAVILVAGIGSRLRPMTDDRPKALVDLGGETILGRSVRILTSYGVRKVVLATGYREDAVRAAMQGAAVAVEYCRNPEFDSHSKLRVTRVMSCCTGHRRFLQAGWGRGVPASSAGTSGRFIVGAVGCRRRGTHARRRGHEGDPLAPGRMQIGAFGKGIALAKCRESIGIERISSSFSPSCFSALDSRDGRRREPASITRTFTRA